MLRYVGSMLTVCQRVILMVCWGGNVDGTLRAMLRVYWGGGGEY